MVQDEKHKFKRDERNRLIPRLRVLPHADNRTQQIILIITEFFVSMIIIIPQIIRS